MTTGAPMLERRGLFADRSLVGAAFCRAYSRRVDEWLIEVFADAARAAGLTIRDHFDAGKDRAHGLDSPGHSHNRSRGNAGVQGDAGGAPGRGNVWAGDDGGVRGVALVAVGGYGRGELSPHSDLDLLLLHDGSGDVSQLAGEVWYPVWNEGLKLGHAVRTVGETLKLAADDLDTATSLLSLRHLAGDETLSDRLAARARKQWSRRARQWLPRLVADARSREVRHGAVAFRLQPDLKEAAGGLRDLQALGYVALARPDLADPDLAGAEVVPREAPPRGRRRPDLADPSPTAAGPADLSPTALDPAGSGGPLLGEAYETLLAARVELHRATGNARNLLTLEVQADVADALGYPGVEDFMTEVAAAGRTVGWVAEETWARVERWTTPRRGLPHRPAVTLEAGVVLRHDRNEVHLTPDAPLAHDQLLALRVAVAAATRRARIERHSLVRLGSRMPPLADPWPPGARQLFVDLLACGHDAIPVIEALDQVGAVVKILPEWATCRSLLQRNDYHRYTVDRHLCETAAHAARIINERRHESHHDGEAIGRPDLLLVAALLHDIGKGYPGDHTEVGMRVVADIARRMGFEPDDIATLVRLVELHLLLPDVATRRDIDELGTVQRVAAQVRTLDFLELLAALTEADGIATGPSVWSRWKAGLVGGLVQRTAHYLAAGEGTGTVSADGKPAAPDGVDGLGVLDGFDGPTRAFPTAEVLAQMQAGTPMLQVSDADGQIIVVQPGTAGVLAATAGAVSLNGLNVLSAAVHAADGMTALSLFVEPSRSGMAIDWEPVLRDVRAALAGDLVPAERLVRLADAPTAPTGAIAAPRPVVSNYVTFDNEISASTVIEVAAPDKLGLLYWITEALAAAGLHIAGAHVQTLGDHVVDSFYTHDGDGGRITDPDRLADIAAAVRTAASLPAGGEG